MGMVRMTAILWGFVKSHRDYRCISNVTDVYSLSRWCIKP